MNVRNIENIIAVEEITLFPSTFSGPSMFVPTVSSISVCELILSPGMNDWNQRMAWSDPFLRLLLIDGNSSIISISWNINNELIIEIGKITNRKLSVMDIKSDLIKRLILLLIGYKKIAKMLANRKGKIIEDPM